MGLRALVGTLTDTGAFTARPIHDDGCPTLIVPTLLAIWQHTFAGDLDTTVAALLTHSWTRLDANQARLPDWNTDGYLPKVGQFSPNDGPENIVRGRVASHDPGDREWAYLFNRHRLSVHVGVGHRYNRRGIWRLAACWPATALRHVTDEELRAVQSYGNLARHHARYGNPPDEGIPAGGL